MLSLQACQSLSKDKVTKAPQTIDAEKRQQALAELKRWEVSGKLIFKSPQKKFSASLRWIQEDPASDIRLTTFLGISIMKMVSDGHHATLSADGKTYVSDNPESLLYQTTGMTLPVNNLSQWMKGATSEYQHFTTVLDQYNRIKQIQLFDANNQQWHIDYQSYRQVGAHQLPDKIRLAGNGITATIKISQWELNPSD